jgi:hypothetical protein
LRLKIQITKNEYLLLRAYDNWANLESITQEKAYFPIGILYFGEPHDSVLASTSASAQYFIFKNDLKPKLRGHTVSFRRQAAYRATWVI